MADDKCKRGSLDRQRVAAGQPHEVAYFAKENMVGANQSVEYPAAGYFATGAQGARISFPQPLPLANPCYCGSDARFSCERPGRLRVRDPKRRYYRPGGAKTEPHHNWL